MIFLRSNTLLLAFLAFPQLASAQKLLHQFDGEPLDRYGFAVAGAGDVDGDGIPDVAIGSLNRFVDIRSGADGGLIRRYSRPDVERFGASVAAGDFDGDGIPDLAIGGPRYDPGGIPNLGLVEVYSGATGGLLYSFTDARGGEFGRSLDNAGDVNNDGHDDIIVGTPRVPTISPGYFNVYSGLDGSILYSYLGTQGSFLAEAVAGVGDVNQDGFDDFAASAPGPRRVYVYSGFDGSILFILQNNEHNSAFGIRVAGLGDTNGDGIPDIAVSAHNSDIAGNLRGAVYVYSGADGSLILTVPGPYPDASLGIGLSAAGDIDGDGLADIFAGSKGSAPGAYNSGFARVYSGLTGIVLAEYYGQAYDEIGSSLAHCGDMDGDGKPELIVGGFNNDVVGPASGRVWVYTQTCPAPVTTCVGAPNSAGPGATLGHLGSFDMAANDLVLTLSGGVPNQPALFFYASEEDMRPFGDGTLCIGPGRTPVIRLPFAIQMDGYGNGQRPLNLFEPPASSGPGWILPAQQWYFQVWYRDPAGPGGTGSNLSSAFRATFCF